jgi:hypothetical protein
VIPQRTRPIGMTDHTDKTLDIGRNARFTLATGQRVNHNLPIMLKTTPIYYILTDKAKTPPHTATF